MMKHVGSAINRPEILPINNKKGARIGIAPNVLIIMIDKTVVTIAGN